MKSRKRKVESRNFRISRRLFPAPCYLPLAYPVLIDFCGHHGAQGQDKLRSAQLVTGQALQKPEKQAVLASHAVGKHDIGIKIHDPMRMTAPMSPSGPFAQQPNVRRRGKRENHIRLAAFRHQRGKQRTVKGGVIRQLPGEPTSAKAGRRKPDDLNSIPCLSGRERILSIIGPARTQHPHLVPSFNKNLPQVMQILPGWRRIGGIKLVEKKKPHKTKAEIPKPKQKFGKQKFGNRELNSVTFSCFDFCFLLSQFLLCLVFPIADRQEEMRRDQFLAFERLSQT